MERVRSNDEFAHLFGHLRDQLLVAFVASFGPVTGRATAVDVLSYARQHWITIRHRDDLILHLYRIGHRLGSGHEQWSGDDLVSDALADLSDDERLPVVLVLGLGWPFDAVTEVTGISVAALHRHHDHGLAKVAASLRSAGFRDPAATLRVWTQRALTDLPEITLAEIDSHHAPHALPISGWRRFSRAVGSVVAGILLVVGLGLVGWQLIEWGDDVVAGWAGSDPSTTLPGSVGTVPSTTLPEGTITFTWTDHSSDLGFPAGNATDLAVGPDGAVWVAIEDPDRLHVAVHDRLGWSVRDEGLEEIAHPVRWLAVSGGGVAWMAVATDEGGDQLYRFDGARWERLVDLSLWGSVAHEGSGGQLWAAGLDDRMRPTRLEWAGDKWIITRAETALTVGGNETTEGLQPEDLELRIAIDDGGVAWYAGDTLTVRFDGRRVISVGSGGDPWVAVAPDDTVWTPTQHGVRRYSEGAWSYFDARHGLPGIAPVAGTVRFAPAQTWVEFDSGEGQVGYVFNGAGWVEAGAAPPGSGLKFGPIGVPRYAYTPGDSTEFERGDAVWYSAKAGWVPVPGESGDELGDVRRVLSDPNGTLWVIAGDELGSVRIEEA